MHDLQSVANHLSAITFIAIILAAVDVVMLKYADENPLEWTNLRWTLN